jgi:hypothetical protein
MTWTSSAFREAPGPGRLLLLSTLMIIPLHSVGQDAKSFSHDAGVTDGSPDETDNEIGEHGPPDMPPKDAAIPGNVGAVGNILILPTCAGTEGVGDTATFDVLLSSAFREVGFTVMDTGKIIEGLHADSPDLNEAREAYLSMDLERALALVQELRQVHLDHRGDLLGEEGLIEAELFMVQLLLDLGRVPEALDLGVEILMRRPGLRLDPVEYSPAMQALWFAAIERRSGRQPVDHSKQQLTELGQSTHANWVAAALTARDQDDVVSLVITLVSTKGGVESSRHSIRLGKRSWWATEIRLVLEERFPKSEPQETIPPQIPDGPKEGDEIDEKTPWYKTWWFWTAVGVAVVGGTVGGIAGYNASKSDDHTTTMDPGW